MLDHNQSTSVVLHNTIGKVHMISIMDFIHIAAWQIIQGTAPVSPPSLAAGQTPLPSACTSLKNRSPAIRQQPCHLPICIAIQSTTRILTTSIKWPLTLLSSVPCTPPILLFSTCPPCPQQCQKGQTEESEEQERWSLFRLWSWRLWSSPFWEDLGGLQCCTRKEWELLVCQQWGRFCSGEDAHWFRKQWPACRLVAF